MQLIVHFTYTRSIFFNLDIVKGIDVKNALANAENLQVDSIGLTLRGLRLSDNDIIPSECDCQIVRGFIRTNGGKGGYGAMLRSMAKQSGKKPTTDFGACRDLSGRRLRHVNDEIILQKWKDAREKGETFDPYQITRTGIDMWFLPAPGWTEGFSKPSHRKVYMKDRRKSRICLDWERARKNGKAPSGAPIWWGCPRGPRCEYAHGETELPESSRHDLEEERKKQRIVALQAKRQKYISSADSDSIYDEQSGGILAVVAAGLQASKRLKIEEQKVTNPLDTPAVLPLDFGDTKIAHHSNNLLLESKPPEVSVSIEGLSSSDVIESIVQTNWLTVLEGSSANPVEGSMDYIPPSISMDGIIIGNGQDALGSVKVAGGCALTSGSWYFEVEILSEGLVQVL